MKKNKLIWIILIIIIIIFSFCGCLESENKNDNNITKEKVYWHNVFQVKIIYELNESYEIYVPVPIEYETNQSTLLNNLTIISGNGYYEEINTNYGKALKIISNGSIELKNEEYYYSPYENELLLYDFLSMQNNSIINRWDVEEGPHDYWIFFNGKGNVSIIIHAERNFSRPTTSKFSNIDGTVFQGWQTISGVEGTIDT